MLCLQELPVWALRPSAELERDAVVRRSRCAAAARKRRARPPDHGAELRALPLRRHGAGRTRSSCAPGLRVARDGLDRAQPAGASGDGSGGSCASSRGSLACSERRGDASATPSRAEERLTVANLHGSARATTGAYADAELLRAAASPRRFAEPGDVLVVAGRPQRHPGALGDDGAVDEPRLGLHQAGRRESTRSWFAARHPGTRQRWPDERRSSGAACCPTMHRWR